MDLPSPSGRKLRIVIPNCLTPCWISIHGRAPAHSTRIVTTRNRAPEHPERDWLESPDDRHAESLLPAWLLAPLDTGEPTESVKLSAAFHLHFNSYLLPVPFPSPRDG
jgi:hypothetical protein